MSGLLEPLFQGISPLIDFLAESWIYLVTALCLVLVALYFLITQMIQLGARWREAGGWRQPLSFMPLYLFKIKGKIEANKEIRDFYEPGAEHIEELGEKEHILPTAWLSEHPVAARASIKKTKIPKGHKLNVRKQIRELGDWIRVREMPEFVFFAGDKQHHFFVELSYRGRDEEAVERLGKFVKTELGAHSIERVSTKSQSSIGFAVHMEEPENPLIDHGKDHTWLDENPAKDPKSLPVAITGDGTQAWNFPMRHTVVLGQTGGGKGSVMHAIVRQQAPFVLDGSVVLHGIDGKAWEMRPYKQVPGLFKEVAFEADEMAELIFDLKEQMEARARSMGIDTENMKAEMTVEPTPEHPWHILVIDELWDFIAELGGLKHPAYQALNSIGRKGRALGFWIVAFTQTVEMSEIGNLRKHFVNKIALAQDSAGFNKYMLGEDAAEQGFDSTAIPVGDKYAGLGFVKGQAGKPEIVRFAYSHGDQVVRLAVETQRALAAKRGGKPAPEDLDDFSDDGEFAITDEGEQLPELETFELDDFDEPLPRG